MTTNSDLATSEPTNVLNQIERLKLFFETRDPSLRCSKEHCVLWVSAQNRQMTLMMSTSFEYLINLKSKEKISWKQN